MIIGVDLEETKRFKIKKSSNFAKNTFTKKELEYAYEKRFPEKTLAGIFCAKEALIKTLKNQAVLLKDIEVSHDKGGRPRVRIIKQKKFYNISISHTNSHAIAVVIND